MRGPVAPVIAALAVAAAACAGEAPLPAVPPAVAPAPSPPPAEAPPPAPARPAFENPGGMWMPEQIPAHGETLAKLGLTVDPLALASPTSDVLQAVVSLGGCSASFVSPEGLVATNHHCAIGALQYNASPKENLLENGWLARGRADEKWAGPTARVYVTEALRDVTKEVRAGVEDTKDDLARHKEIEKRQKALVAACEKGRPEVRCSVAEFFGGGQYRLVEQLEIKDVRLVFAPHMGVGNFGGEIDNWRWPRHTGDVTLLRAYVGKDGKPAEHAEGNVPYKPKHWLKIADAPLAPGDLVMVAGYPGRTNRLRTAGEAEEAVAWTYPHLVQYLEENIAAIEGARKDDQELVLKSTPTWRGFHNALTKYRGILEGLGKGGLVDAKKKGEAGLGPAAAAIDALVAERRKTRDADTALVELYKGSQLLAAAAQAVQMAEERPKADADREAEFQERNWARLAEAQRSAQKRYARPLDKALLDLALARAKRLPEKGRPAWVAWVKDTAALYAGTSLEDAERRVALLQKASSAELARSRDPFVQLALRLRPLQKQAKERDDRFAGSLVILRPRYVAELEKRAAGPIAPDANSTLRLTFGTVRGYRPTPEATPFAPFTVVSEMLKKAGKEPFHAPGVVLDAARAKRFGPYADARLGDLPVDFLSDLDITGGNSGSATLNGKGELVGLAFDGNYESMASDWVFLPSVTRTIHVDARYVLWLLDAVYGGDHLLREMGRTPSVE